MSSVSRSFAQRNTNEINVIPVYQESGEWNEYDALTIDPRYASVFNVDLSGFQYVTGWDVNDRLDVYGKVNDTYTSPPIAYSYLNIDSGIATAYPGLQFTINFNWSEGDDYQSFVSLYVNADPRGPHAGDEADILSPGDTFNNFYTASVTIRSNGTRWVVVSSGPVTWSGDWDY